MAVVARPRRQSTSPRTRSADSAWGKRAIWILAAIIALGAAVRFSTLSEQSFWFDEAVTQGIVRHGLGHVLATIPKTESTPPLYYVLVWLWSRAFGLSEAGLRSFSALCGTLTISVVWAVGRRLVSERVGLIAALLTAVNPFLFWYAQEARAYSLALLLSTLSLLALVSACAQPTRGRLLRWGIASAAALATHYFAAVIIVPEAVWLLLTLRSRGCLNLERAAIAIAPVAAVGAALLPLMISQNDGRASYISEYGGSLPYRLAQLVKEDVVGDGQPVKVLLGGVGILLVLVGLLLLVRRGGSRERAGAGLPLAIGAGGILLGLIVSLTVVDYFNTRNLVPTWPALALVVASGLGARRAGRIGALATAGLAVLGLVCVSNIVRDPRFQRDNWRGAAHAAGPVRAARAIVSDVHSEASLDPYLPGLGAYPAAGLTLDEVDVLWLGRGGPWQPLRPVSPVPLPGFRMREIRTSSYIVLRYLAQHPEHESTSSLDRLYPNRDRALTLLQQP